MPDRHLYTHRQTDDSRRDPHVLPNGAEIHFTDDRDAVVPDRVRFLPGGFVMAVYKRRYNLEVYPPDRIRGVHTHTNHLEEEDWW